MTDPAVAYTPDDQEYGAYHRGKDLNIYLKTKDGSDFLGLVWPGWFYATIELMIFSHSNSQVSLCTQVKLLFRLLG